MARRFELVEGTSRKFWEVSLSGCEVTTRYGRIGSAGQTTTKLTETTAAAEALVAKLVAEKTKKGYVEGDAAHSTPSHPEAAGVATTPIAATNAEPAHREPKAAPDQKPRRAARDPQGLLSAVKEKNLLAKLRGEELDVHEHFVKASPGRDDVALFADLAGRRLLGFEHGALIASLLRYGRHVDPALLWAWLRTLPAPQAPLPGSSGGCPLDDFVLEHVPLRLFVGVRAAWKRAPELLDPNAPDTPDFLRDTLWLIRAQAGQSVPEADRLRLLDGLARQATRPHAIPRSFDRVDPEDPFVWHAVSWFATTLGATRDDFAERLLSAAPEGAYGALLVALTWLEAKPDGRFDTSFSPLVRRLPSAGLVQALLERRERFVVGPGFDEYGFERGRSVSAGLVDSAVLCLLDARDDGAETVFAMVDELRSAAAERDGSAARNLNGLADIFTLVALERDSLGSRPVDPAWMLRAGGQGFLADRVRALFPRLRPEALELLAQHDEEYPDTRFARSFGFVAEAIAGLPDARARVEALVRRSRPRYGTGALLAMGRGLVAATADALEWLLDVRAHSSDIDDLGALRRRTLILIGGLAEAARRGLPLPEGADVHVGPGEVEAHPRHDWRHDLAGDTQEAYGEVLAALPTRRRQPIVAAWIAADPTGKLGIREWIAGMPTEVQSEAPSSPGTADVVRRLVERSRATADTTIYVLEPCAAEETAPTLRVAARLPGLDEARTPTRNGEAFEHLITFDFGALPALAQVKDAAEEAVAFPGAAGIAVFLRDGGAWEEDNDDVEVVPLSREELSQGHEGGVPFRAVAVEVPAKVFVSAERDADPALASIWEALGVPAGVAGGAARRIQGDQETYGVEKSFLFDADARLLPIGMGDAGRFHGYSFGGFLESH